MSLTKALGYYMLMAGAAFQAYGLIKGNMPGYTIGVMHGIGAAIFLSRSDK